MRKLNDLDVWKNKEYQSIGFQVTGRVSSFRVCLTRFGCSRSMIKLGFLSCEHHVTSGISIIHYSVPGHFRSRHHKHGVNRSRKHSDNATQRRHHAATTTAVSEPLKTEAQVSR